MQTSPIGAVRFENYGQHHSYESSIYSSFKYVPCIDATDEEIQSDLMNLNKKPEKVFTLSDERLPYSKKLFTTYYNTRPEIADIYNRTWGSQERIAELFKMHKYLKENGLKTL